MSNLSTYRAPLLKGNAATYGSATTIPVLVLDGKGNAVISTAPLSTNLSTFTNDAGFISGVVSASPMNNAVVQRDSNGRMYAASLNLTGTTGATDAASGINAGIELGRLDVAATPYIDFHSAGTSTDFDVRLIASGGATQGGLGALNFYGSSMNFNSPVFAGALQTTAANVNLYLSETAHATSKRASMRIGAGWEMGQDPSVNGAKDFYLYNTALGTNALIANVTTNNLTFTGSLTSAGNISAAGQSVGTIRTASKGAIQLAAGNTTNSGYLEFFPPGSGARHGYVGYGDGTTINLSAEIGYFNFIGNAPRVAGQPIVAQNGTNGVTQANFVVQNTNSAATMYTDAGQNNVIFRTGPSSAYRYSYFDTNGALTTGSGFFNSDLHTNRGDASGYCFYGNQNVAFVGYDGANVLIKGNGTNSLIYRNTTTANYVVFDKGNINPIIDIRLSYAGDLDASWNSGNVNLVDPYAGGVITSQRGYNSGGHYVYDAARWRYLQKCDSNSNWYTVISV